MNKPKILVVDDQSRNLVAMEHALSDLDAELLLVSSGEEALKCLLKNEFCVILLDVQMPEMDGFETASLIRQSQFSNDVPIIFMTAFSKDHIHQIKGYKSGAVDYLIKPVDDFILENKVKVFLELYRRNQSNLAKFVDELMDLKAKLEQKNKMLMELAIIDSLTGLNNRLSFEQELTRCLAFALRHDEQFALLLIDLDNFKYINDHYGHQFGDGILQKVSKSLSNILRAEDFVARIGGDEFALIQTKYSSLNDVTQTAKRIIAILNQVYQFQQAEVQLGCSIGIACYPFAGDKEETLVKHADIAMYRAKSLGKNQYQFYSYELSKMHTRRVSIELNLKKSLLEQNDFYLVYQPIFDLANNKIVSVEALLRWCSNELGNVSPEEFIPIAEDVGLIHELGNWVLKQAIMQLQSWRDSGIKDLAMAINVSPLQLNEPLLIKNLCEILAKLDVPASQIEFEITENALLKNEKQDIKILNELSNLGIKINLDDFGTGHSSLVRLKDFPLSTIKIDRSFVYGLSEDPNKREIIKAIISLSKCLNLDVIAEGIELQDELNFLIKHNCQFGQGFLLSKPISSKELTKIMND